MDDTPHALLNDSYGSLGFMGMLIGWQYFHSGSLHEAFNACKFLISHNVLNSETIVAVDFNYFLCLRQDGLLCAVADVTAGPKLDAL